MTSLVDADSLLVVDVGSITTRAILFDVVEGQYRFVACGQSPTTAIAPDQNIGEGVRQAMDQLQDITGRILVGPDEKLLMPSSSDGSGVDSFAALISAGEPLRVVVMGLLEDVSVDSARRLAMTTYSKVIQTFSLNDRRKTDARLNAILRLQPNVILAAGGTENGASQSVSKLLEAVGLACYLMPAGQRPEVLFAGNQALKDDLKGTLEGVASVNFVPNVRPSLDVDQVDAALLGVAKTFVRVRSQQMGGVEELNSWAGGGLLPTCTAYGRMIRFLSQAHVTKKGVLGIDVGAAATTVAAAYAGDLSLNVFTQLGLGSGLAELAQSPAALQEILGWVAIDFSENKLCDYLYHKSLYPASLPVSEEEMTVEQAIARYMMRQAIRLSARNFPLRLSAPGEGLLPWFEPIVATGSVLTRAPTLAQSALMLLDGLQPVGVTTLVLDQNQIVAALGAAAALNPILVVQTLDSNSFLPLGTVVAPVGNERPGSPVLRLKMTYESGHEASLEVKQGALEVLPLPAGQVARLQLQPLHRYNVGMGAPGRGGGLRVMGGALGVIIDARGRPLKVPEDRTRRHEVIRKWLWTLGGQ
jgi:hypothetical protein